MKIYIQKTIHICAIGLFILVLAGCSKLLDQEPQGAWTDKDNAEGSFQSDAFTLYAKIRGFGITAGTPPLAIQNFRSEDAEKGSTTDDGSLHASMYDEFDYIALNELSGTYWTAHYELIHIANGAIANMKRYEEIGGVLQETDYQVKSELHFFRAFAYFNLVRAYGEVPLIDFQLIEAADANIPKSPAAAIYELIDSDLTEAIKYLPIQWESKYIGRLTKGAATALKARTHMMRNEWSNMYNYSITVINSGQYNLDTPYDKIFRETGENSSESIFEIQCTATPSLNESDLIGSTFVRSQAIRGSGDWDQGWGWHTPTQLLADAFEPNDPRKDETLLYFIKIGEDPSSITPNKPWGEIPIALGGVINKYYNKKAYTDPALRKLYAKSGYWYNIRIIRYSDVVLMAAESANELGKTDEAQMYLEMVRERARGGNTSILPKVTTSDQALLREAIRKERRVELGMEWDRFYDLVRWGIARQTLHAAGKTRYEDKHALLPIPQPEIDKSGGVLIQNPNY